MTAQIVDVAGQKIALLPLAEYEQLVEMAEDQADIAAFDRAETRRVAREQYLPFALVRSIIDGKNALLAWREHRDFSLADLADKAGVPASEIDLIERGGEATGRTWRALANALSVEIEDIIPVD